MPSARPQGRLYEIGGNGEADAVRAAAAREDGRVDADQLAIHVHQRTAGIARIDRGIGLDEDAEITRRDLVAGKRGNNAARDRLADAEGIADSKDEITDFDLVGIGKRQNREMFLRLDAQDREIDGRILQDDLAGKFPTIGECNLDVIGIFDDVVVGDDEAILRKDHAGAQRRLLFRTVRHALAEELFEEGITGKRALTLHETLGIDIDHGAGRALDQRREGELHLLVALRYNLRGILRQRHRRDCGRTHQGQDEKTGRQAFRHREHVIPHGKFASICSAARLKRKVAETGPNRAGGVSSGTWMHR